MARSHPTAPLPAGDDPVSVTVIRPRSRTRRLAATVGLVVVVAGSLAACGAATPSDDVASLATGDQAGGTSTTVAAPLSEEEIQEAQEAFTACMKEHGVEVNVAAAPADGSAADGGFVTRAGGGDKAPDGAAMPSKDEMDAANRECQPLMDKVIQNAPKPDPEEFARMKEQALAFAQCMRDNGVDMPDPEFSEDGGGITQTMDEGVGEDPDMDAAQEACKDLMKGPNGESMPIPAPGEGPSVAIGPATGSSGGSE